MGFAKPYMVFEEPYMVFQDSYMVFQDSYMVFRENIVHFINDHQQCPLSERWQLPSINKGKHACQRVFPSLFVLFALAGARPPASQKPKIARISIAGRCGQFCRSRNASRQGKARREYCRIVKGLDAVWAYFCPSKPCLPLSTDGIYDVCVSTP